MTCPLVLALALVYTPPLRVEDLTAENVRLRELLWEARHDAAEGWRTARQAERSMVVIVVLAVAAATTVALARSP